MITLRRAEDRRHVHNKGQDTWMTFDPENAADPLRLGFRALESLNEETPLSAMSLHPHPQDDAEVVTYVREGAIVHQQRPGHLKQLVAGEFECARAGGKMRYRVINASFMDPAHVFQSCITPEGSDLDGGTEQKRFPAADREGILRLIASRDGRDGSLRIQQDVQIYSSILLLGSHLIHAIGVGRGAWLHVIKGRLHLREHDLGTGDAAGLNEEVVVSFTAQQASEILLFDLA